MLFSAPFIYSVAMVLIPVVLLAAQRKVKFVAGFLLSYVIAAILFYLFKDVDMGIFGSLIIPPLFIFYRCIPICVLFYYVASTTKVNEFLAAMNRMHVSNKVTIPLTVMIRFLPTVVDEYRAIANAMHMRGIRLFSLNTLKNPLGILEYRLVPLLVSITKIGDELSIAATTRGLSPECKRSCMVPVGFHLQDLVVFLYTIGIIALFAFSDFKLDFADIMNHLEATGLFK